MTTRTSWGKPFLLLFFLCLGFSSPPYAQNKPQAFPPAISILAKPRPVGRPSPAKTGIYPTEMNLQSGEAPHPNPPPKRGRETTEHPRLLGISAQTLYSRAAPAVVGVYAHQGTIDFYGTGILLTPDGYILTTSTTVPAHATSIRIILPTLFRPPVPINKKKSPFSSKTDYHSPRFIYPATVIQTDPALEASILKISIPSEADLRPLFPNVNQTANRQPSLPFLSLGETYSPCLGDPTYTLGNSFNSIFSELQVSMSQGLLSGMYDIDPLKEEMATYRGTIYETTAAVNPGMDGGPLINPQGKMIGLLSLSFSKHRWLGVAIPLKVLLPFLKKNIPSLPRSDRRPLTIDRLCPNNLPPSLAHSPFLPSLISLLVDKTPWSDQKLKEKKIHPNLYRLWFDNTQQINGWLMQVTPSPQKNCLPKNPKKPLSKNPCSSYQLDVLTNWSALGADATHLRSIQAWLSPHEKVSLNLQGYDPATDIALLQGTLDKKLPASAGGGLLSTPVPSSTTFFHPPRRTSTSQLPDSSTWGNHREVPLPRSNIQYPISNITSRPPNSPPFPLPLGTPLVSLSRFMSHGIETLNLTDGLVSAQHQIHHTRIYQCDAKVSFPNAGGMVLSANYKKLLGMITFISNPYHLNRGTGQSNGIGFFTPVDTVMEIYTRLRRDGRRLTVDGPSELTSKKKEIKTDRQRPTNAVSPVLKKFSDAYVFIGRGSGILLGPDGYVLTNDHVIEGFSSLEAHLGTGQTVTAKVMDQDRLGDVALLKILETHRKSTSDEKVQKSESREVGTSRLPDSQTSRLLIPQRIPFGQPLDSAPGSPVLAIGNPFILGTPDYSPTLTHGIVDATPFFSMRYQVGHHFHIHFQALQIDAPINPGNSGGPLFTPTGKLIGLTSSLRSRWSVLLHEPSYFNTGAGYAIPIAYIQKILPLLKKGLPIRHGMISSIRFRKVSFYLTDQGLQIQSIKKGSNADQAGLRAGDRILTVQGFPALNENRFRILCEMFLAGENIELTLRRGEKILKIPVVLEPYAEAEHPAGGRYTKDH